MGRLQGQLSEQRAVNRPGFTGLVPVDGSWRALLTGMLHMRVAYLGGAGSMLGDGVLRRVRGPRFVMSGPLNRATVALVALVALVVVPAAAQDAEPFPDLDSGAYWAVPVTELAEAGVFAGTECAEGFCPYETLDRATMAVWTVRVLDGEDPQPVGSTRFGDVEGSHRHAAFIERFAELGVTQGCRDGSVFCPDGTVTRAEMAVFLTRAFKLPLGPEPGFSDVASDDWYADDVAALAASRITKGCGDGTRFCPGDDTTRAQMATFLHRALALSSDEGEGGTTEREVDSTAGTAIPTRWGTVASIYNDNIFVLPVSQNLSVRRRLPLEDYAEFFYEHFEDEFDFLIFVRNLVSGAEGVVARLPYQYIAVSNEVRGIGQPRFSDATRWGSSGRLQGSVFLTWVEFANLVGGEEWRLFRTGPVLHELMHRWANNILPTSFGGHWGFSSAAGVVGGFDITNLVDRGGGRYTAGIWGGAAGPNKPAHFSSIELYLAGFVPPEEVPDLWVAEDGKWLLDDNGNLVETRNGPVFTAGQVKIYTIEDIIAEHGRRVPNASRSQKDFRAAVILLTDKTHPADPQVLKKLSDDVSWFSHPGVSGTDDWYRGSDVYNFYEATGGRGTITIDGLSEFQR